MLRYADSVRAVKLANLSITALNHLHSPQNLRISKNMKVRNFAPPSEHPYTLVPPGNRAAAERLTNHVREAAVRFCSELRRHKSDHRLVVTDPFEDMRTVNLANSFGWDVNYQHSTTAVPIEAAKVALPSEAGSADLLTILPATIAADYSNEQKLLKSKEQLQIIPRVRPVCLAPQMEYRALIRRMVGLQMIDFTKKPKCVNGVFGVPKDGGAAIRLIVDARPANRLFVKPPSVTLPTPEHIARISCHPDRPLFTLKSDLDNCYHSIRAPAWLRPYFALPPVTAREISPELAAKWGADTKLWPMCTTLPMGWSHSVYVAQTAHERIVNDFTDLRPADRVNAQLRDPNLESGRVLHAEYIDDLSMFSYDPEALQKCFVQYSEAVRRFGLRIKLSKVIGPTFDPVEVLGVVVDGIRHTIAVSAEKLAALISDTNRILRTGLCTGFELSQVIGRWTWAALAARPALSVFSAVYRFVQCSWRRVFTVWDSVRKELALMIGLAPLLVARLSIPEFPYVVATDASSEGLGVCATVLPAGKSIFLPTENEPISGDAQSIDINKLKWHTIMSQRWQNKGEHINVLELRTVLLTVKWMLSYRRSVARRLLVVSDSSTVVGAVRKGRSSSFQLLLRLRSLAAMLLASGVQLRVEWCPSNLNPADEPSRNFDDSNYE